MEVVARNLRTAQIGVSAVAAMTLFLPWGTYLEIMMTDSKFTNISGYQIGFGRCLATFLVGSLMVSALETLLSRRAIFVHIGFFVMSLFIAVIMQLSSVIPSMGLAEVRTGFYLYIAFSTVVFAITGMLSPK